MTVVRKKLGASAETLAAQFLTELGYQVVERNFRCSLGEIDLIVRNATHLIFVEVKSRRYLHYGQPLCAVNWRKQKRLVLLAQWYLKAKKIFKQSCRFDVISIYLPLDGEPVIKHIANAFS